MEQFLESSAYIDWQHPLVLAKAKHLASGWVTQEEIAKSCFEYVRDHIKHSWDYQLNPVTCKASDVLQHETGYCYAKSHLLAALLRANGIPTALCYQRLTISDDQPPFCLHGLNAVYLGGEAKPETHSWLASPGEFSGWYRIDARGNKPGINAQFKPPLEQLAYPIITEGEVDFPELYSKPLPEVVSVLENSRTYQEVADNLPDTEVVLNS